ncbi:hypothetical protein TNCV_2286281 [Trichonephila clavipes]|nr:hypothetical protein TNCV_2286281 [Trichonephila clavipes]
MSLEDGQQTTGDALTTQQSLVTLTFTFQQDNAGCTRHVLQVFGASCFSNSFLTCVIVESLPTEHISALISRYLRPSLDGIDLILCWNVHGKLSRRRISNSQYPTS